MFAHRAALSCAILHVKGPLCYTGLEQGFSFQCDAYSSRHPLTHPFVHTPHIGVCEVGHVTGRMVPLLSVCAHGAPGRVRSRTRGGRFGRLRVRLCTRGARTRAKSDTRLAVSHRSCPLVHTGRPCVCKVGHETGRVAPLLSVCAHRRVPRVHKRTRRRARGLGASARARGQRPAGPRGRPKRSLRADKGCPSSRFSAGLTRRGAPRIAGRHARTSRGESAPRPAEECRTFSEAGTLRRRSGGRA